MIYTHNSMKKITTFLLILWSSFLILFITFGSSVASKVYQYVLEKLNQEEFEIEDINFILEEEYLVGNSYHLNYTVFPHNNIDHGLEFESLNPEIFSVSKDGYITGLRTNSDKTTGKLRITSSKDLLFEKIIDLNFTKTYPDDILLNLSSTFKKENDVYIVYLNIPVDILFSVVGELNKITERVPELIYDHEVFDKTSTYVLLPKKKVDETTISVKLNNFLKEIKVKVIDIVDDPEMYELNSQITNFVMNQGSNEGDIYYTGSNIYAKLYNGNYNIIAPHTFASSNPEIASVSNHLIVPKKAGEVTITATLFNGVKVSKTIQIRNKIYLPEITGLDFGENNSVDIYSNESALIDIVFPLTAEFTDYQIIYDEEALELKKISEFQYQLTAIHEGTHSFKIVVDDGYKTEERLYTLNVTKNSKFIYFFRVYLPTIVTKVMGHMALFAVEGLFVVLFIVFNLSNKKLKSFICFVSIGTFCAGITEFIQLFIPGRSGRIEDMAFDLVGYILGSILFYIIYQLIKGIIYLIKKLSKKKAECKN